MATYNCISYRALISLVILIHVLRVAVYSVNECLQMFRVHVGVHAVTQVSDVPLGAKLCQHLLHVTSDVILDSNNGGRRKQGPYTMDKYNFKAVQ